MKHFSLQHTKRNTGKVNVHIFYKGDNSINFFQSFWVMTSSTKMDCFLLKNHSFLCIFLHSKLLFLAPFKECHFIFKGTFFLRPLIRQKNDFAWQSHHHGGYSTNCVKKKGEYSRVPKKGPIFKLPKTDDSPYYVPFWNHWPKTNIHSSNEWQTLNNTADPKSKLLNRHFLTNQR